MPVQSWSQLPSRCGSFQASSELLVIIVPCSILFSSNMFPPSHCEAFLAASQDIGSLPCKACLLHAAWKRRFWSTLLVRNAAVCLEIHGHATPTHFVADGRTFCRRTCFPPSASASTNVMTRTCPTRAPPAATVLEKKATRLMTHQTPSRQASPQSLQRPLLKETRMHLASPPSCALE